MNKIDLEALKSHALNIDEINTAVEHIKENTVHTASSFAAMKGIDEYLTTAVILIEEVIKNETV
jgi:hypothetical protein